MSDIPYERLLTAETLLIDTHCHIDMESHFPDYLQVLERAGSAGVGAMIMAGVCRKGWSRMIELSRQHKELFAAPGLHPMYLSRHSAADLEELERLAATEKLVAIGEIGLDYHVQGVDHGEQQKLFEAQLDIAARAGLPLLLHVRKAHDRVLAALRRKKFKNGGIVHAFNGSQQQAEQFVGLGFKIGICGTITFDRARKIRRVASALPLDALVLETDSPDIPPATYRGERNLPEYLPDVLASLAEIRCESRMAIVEQTTRNACGVLALS